MTGVALAISAANCVLMFLTFRRASSWKEGEDAQRLIDRVGRCETDITAIQGSPAAITALALRVGAVESATEGLKIRFENVATKADIARLTAEVSGVEQLIKNTDAGVVRIEHLLMRASA
jgi:hypothetical protein